MNDQEERVRGAIERLRRLGTDSTHVEVKAAAGGLPSTVGESISAMANGDGGLIILGLREPDFTPADGFDARRIQDALARLCTDDMEPPVRESIEILEVDGAPVVVLDVAPLDPLRRPSHLKRKGPYGGSYIRGGDGDRRLTSYEVTQFLSNQAQPTDDREVVSDATMEDLDPAVVHALLRRLGERPSRAFTGIDDDTALRRAGAADLDPDGILRPTLAGLLCLGRYPQQFFPQLYASFVAVPGASMGDSLSDGTRFLDNVTCDGTLPDIVDAVLVAARRNMRSASVIRGAGRMDRFDYPTDVIRELVVNALLHRDYSPLAQGTHVQIELYSDRLVVKSPGGLYGTVTPGDLGVVDVSSTRNAALARLLSDVVGADGRPVCESRGSGLPTVMQRLRQAGMSPPAFDTAPGHVHVTVPQHALLSPETVAWIGAIGAGQLDDHHHLALALMHERGSVSNAMLRAWGVHPSEATATLRDLVDRGLAVRLGGRRYATYRLLDEPALLPARSLPERGTPRSARIRAELDAVVEAIRAGHDTTQSVMTQLGISYATANRRINTLLAEGRLEGVEALTSRKRRYRAL